MKAKQQVDAESTEGGSRLAKKKIFEKRPQEKGQSKKRLGLEVRKKCSI